MSYFQTLLRKNDLHRHDRRPLWQYYLSIADAEDLKNHLRFKNQYTIDERDAALYFAVWWANWYNGGKPSKKEVFESLEGNIRYNLDEDQFFDIAKKGGRRLGLRWLRRQNTLYLRTLFLQGGLPMLHIAENGSSYQDFLLAVLNEEPNTIEDFMNKQKIIDILPVSSRNKVIYENSLEIVNSFINEDDTYDKLFKSNAVLERIFDELKIRGRGILRKTRVRKPQVYWSLNLDSTSPKISLNIGFDPSYNKESLTSILGFEAENNEYQFYLNDKLICTFRKMLNDDYKTDWIHDYNFLWDINDILPNAYVISNNEKIEVNDFIQFTPNLSEPSLWAKQTDEYWRLIKGNAHSSKEVAVLSPKEWETNLSVKDLSLYDKNLFWIEFEGELSLSFENKTRFYQSEVNSFNWTIQSHKPRRLLKTNMPVIQNKLEVFVYDEDNNRIQAKDYKVFYRNRRPNAEWHLLTDANSGRIPTGCIDLKIVKDGITAYDVVYNIDKLKFEYLNESINNAKIEIKDNSGLTVQLNETDILSIEKERYSYHLKVDTTERKIPTHLKGSLGLSKQRKLYFQLESPFNGLAIIDNEGQIIDLKAKLSIDSLYGLRLLGASNLKTELKIINSFKPEVYIRKAIGESNFPLISLKDDILRLFYLQDAMNYRNKVSLEINSGKTKISIDVSLFSHTLNVEQRYENRFTLNKSDENLELFAVPMNQESSRLDLIPLKEEDSVYSIPDSEEAKQFIIISPKENAKQLMPRFVNLDTDYIDSRTKEERIENYHQELLETSFEDEVWTNLLFYFNICKENEIPFSTFDQLLAISRSSEVAARAYFYLSSNQYDADEFAQSYSFELERDLGFCFHWIKASDWGKALFEIMEFYKAENLEAYVGLFSSYFQEIEMSEIVNYILSSNKAGIEETVNRQDINRMRGELGDRVIRELPHFVPAISDTYGIPKVDIVKLLLHAPIAVAESIKGVKKDLSIWGGKANRASIRRNIQYVQYLDRNLSNTNMYKRIILQVLSK